MNNRLITWNAREEAYGEGLPNGTWTGVVGKLVNREIDIAARWSMDTYNYFQFTLPYWKTEYRDYEIFCDILIISKKIFSGYPFFQSQFTNTTPTGSLIYLIVTYGT